MVWGHSYENYLTQKVISHNIYNMKCSQFTINLVGLLLIVKLQIIIIIVAYYVFSMHYNVIMEKAVTIRFSLVSSLGMRMHVDYTS